MRKLRRETSSITSSNQTNNNEKGMVKVEGRNYYKTALNDDDDGWRRLPWKPKAITTIKRNVVFSKDKTSKPRSYLPLYASAPPSLKEAFGFTPHRSRSSSRVNGKG
ncbi:hypothetical protein CEXT_782491 [Caerostris extrusa]|uniref:Uncharacterized protein n=1 Tax=Caerostris extrusa TaxID=172846 RepID=A0AAV4MHV9_CAEEX|nr:hypothetical protein CEXT_782491 [Caerostris extrusa]